MYFIPYPRNNSELTMRCQK